MLAPNRGPNTAGFGAQRPNTSPVVSAPIVDSFAGAPSGTHVMNVQTGTAVQGTAAATGGACITPGGLDGRWANRKIPKSRGGGVETYCKAKRRIDPGNVKALRRSHRRDDQFIRLAKRATKGTKWKVVSRASTTTKAPKTVIVESGRGSVVT